MDLLGRRVSESEEGQPFRLSVERMLLTQFRSYSNLVLEVGPGPVVLIGDNGAGKTNLLEALSLLAPGRGLRGARVTDMRRRGAEETGWGVAVELSAVGGSIQIGTGVSSKADGTREVRVQGAASSSQDGLARELHVIWLTPQMDRIFIGSPGDRRRFFDRLVLGFDPGHSARLGAYQRTLAERARILRYRPDDTEWLSALERTMSENAVAISAARHEALWRLNTGLASPLGTLFPPAELELVGVAESLLQDWPALEVEERLLKAFAAARAEDAAKGGSSVGPHRTDLSVRHVVNDIPAEHCSTGEQKMLLVSIILAHAQAQSKLFGQTPLILLDEVMAHLDGAHRSALTEALCSLGSQVWMTGTTDALFSKFGSRGQFLHVSDGAVRNLRMGDVNI
ncbi:MAG: DNA replication/repair protein RecF [Pseudomonadota bacterium]|nr:DNA replication/repair protein RecF [Pseudomonadota bacterium]